MSKVIGIVGSRRRNSEDDYKIVVKVFFDNYVKGDIIVSGGCPKGADHFAELIASSNDICIKIFPANWNKYGRGAGIIRNTDIAKMADMLIACVAADRKGGTEDTVKKFKKFHPSDKIVLC